MHVSPLGIALVVIFMAVCGPCLAQKSVDSLYTDIAGKACSKTLDDKSAGAYTLTCPGVGGYSLHIMEDDERSSVNVVTPDKRVFPLEYWDVVTHGFSSLGKKAEWRVTKVSGKTVPIALIIRVNAVDQDDLEHPRRVPLLAVAQIRKDTACVVTKLNAATPTANAQARELADAEGQACLKSDATTTPLSKG